jgi:hypothetical protein
VFLWLIVYNGFFGLFRDPAISRKKFAFLFFLKTLAIPIFYLVYEKIYGGLEKFDSGKFYNDVKVISGVAKSDIGLYLRLLLGMQSDQKTSYDFIMLADTVNWDNGVIKDYLYNDNRVLVRIHSLFHFISFNSYFVHALFNCFLSFVGITCLYKTFKEFFKGKETGVLVILCLFPALWFYTGALLKEGVTFFVLGCTLFLIKKIVENRHGLKDLLWLAPLLYVSCFLKPYILIFAIICFTAFFIIYRWRRIRYKTVVFFLVMITFTLGLNTVSLLVKHKSLYTAALTHQRIFSGVAKGGIFLYNKRTFLRLEYDTSLVVRVSGQPDRFRIKENAAYMYWRRAETQDTLYCAANKDTLSAYNLAYMIPVSRSNISQSVYLRHPLSVFAACLYVSLAYPLFIGAKTALLMLASFENLLILVSLIVIAAGLIRRKKENFLPLTFLFFALGICLLVGLTTPNSGAIFRYRSPAAVFILLAALYYLERLKSKQIQKI